ncbi:30S ribosomal protein S4 [Candidatus Woesearchaeota archaeon]|nr:30S ribosomal protein S4 [Candidatus Woesearchaeota archaeon]
MGDPKKQKNKYQTPSHPWQRSRLENETKLRNDYGLRRKDEIWKMQSLLRSFKQQAKKLIARTDPQSETEEKLLLQRLYKFGLIEKDSTPESILDLEEKKIFDRRLQSFVFRLGFARSIKQARQFIIHGHILVNQKEVSVPSYIVKRNEENNIRLAPNSSLSDPEHPERKPALTSGEKKVLTVKPGNSNPGVKA